MHFGTKKGHHEYVMDGQKLAEVKTQKDLGVIIGDNLKVSDQCTQACNRANRLLGLMRRTMSSRDPVIMTRLYKSLVRPHLEYCSVAWSPYYKKDKEQIERVQHRVTRLSASLRQIDYPERLKRLNLWSLEERRNRADLIELFKMCHGLSATKLDTFFTRVVDARTRGHTLNLKKTYCGSEARYHFFSNRVVNRGNQLEPEDVEVTAVNTF